jgi:5'-3' exonuclease
MLTALAQTVAIDGHCWLHRATYGCAKELQMGVRTLRHVRWFYRRVQGLLLAGVKVYVVFDGRQLPAKERTEIERRTYVRACARACACSPCPLVRALRAACRRRESSLAKAREMMLQSDGPWNAKAVTDLFAKSLDISPQHVYDVCCMLRALGVPFVVAPYEADAQLAFLIRAGLVDAVVTEDSDLLAYGCKRVLYKMNHNFEADEIRLEHLAQVRESGVSFAHWNHEMFVRMCILSGCDFVASPNGVGVKKAHKLVHSNRTLPSVRSRVRPCVCARVPTSRSVQLFLALRRDYGTTADYENDFMHALWTFHHQLVFNVEARCLQHLAPVPDDVRENAERIGGLAFLGAKLDDDVGRRIAACEIDPVTLAEFPPAPPASELARLWPSSGDMATLLDAGGAGDDEDTDSQCTSSWPASRPGSALAGATRPAGSSTDARSLSASQQYSQSQSQSQLLPLTGAASQASTSLLSEVQEQARAILSAHGVALPASPTTASLGAASSGGHGALHAGLHRGVHSVRISDRRSRIAGVSLHGVGARSASAAGAASVDAAQTRLTAFMARDVAAKALRGNDMHVLAAYGSPSSSSTSTTTASSPHSSVQSTPVSALGSVATRDAVAPSASPAVPTVVSRYFSVSRVAVHAEAAPASTPGVAAAVPSVAPADGDGNQAHLPAATTAPAGTGAAASVASAPVPVPVPGFVAKRLHVDRAGSGVDASVSGGERRASLHDTLLAGAYRACHTARARLTARARARS